MTEDVGIQLEGSYPLTDAGNAERFVQRHGLDVRYCHLWRKWLTWTGTHWQVDNTGQVGYLAMETVRSIYQEAAECEDSKLRQTTAHWAHMSESASHIAAIPKLATSSPKLTLLPEALDAHPWLLNCANGTFDLLEGVLRPHDRDDLITKCTDIDYSAEAQAPLWTAFLDAITQHDPTLQTFLKRAAGYSASGSTRERVLFILHGTGSNGKTTLVEMIATALGTYASNTYANVLYESRNSGDSRFQNEIAHLKALHFVFASEGGLDKRMAEAEVKRLTGGDQLRGHFLYGESFSFLPYFKLWLATNHKPSIRGTDQAIWDRIRLIPFNARFEGAAQDNRLRDKLTAELSGILTWIIEGAVEWQLFGLGDSPAVAAANAAYRQAEDALGTFLDEVCVQSVDVTVLRSALYKTYVAWCKEGSDHPMSSKSFATALRERGLKDARYTGGPHKDKWYWQNVGLSDIFSS